MKLEELVKELENVKYKIKQTKFKIFELKGTSLPGKNMMGMGSHSSGGTSPQEKIVCMIDALERELVELENESLAISEEIYREIERIENPRNKWIVTQRARGKAWSDIECEGLSIGYIKHIYKATLNELNGGETNGDKKGIN